MKSTTDVKNGLAAVESGVAEAAPAALPRWAAQAEDLARRGAERARDAAASVQEQARRAGDRTVDAIRDEPVKAVLVAAAAGAATALALRWLVSARPPRG